MRQITIYFVGDQDLPAMWIRFFLVENLSDQFDIGLWNTDNNIVAVNKKGWESVEDCRGNVGVKLKKLMPFFTKCSFSDCPPELKLLT